jgi:hypothetical protein
VLADSARTVSIPPINGIESHQPTNLPAHFALHQNYPNPFNPSTTLLFDIPRTERVSIRIYNVLGDEIAVVAEGIYATGRHHVVWDGQTQYGRSAGSGIYFARLEAGTFKDTKKIVLIK